VSKRFGIEGEFMIFHAVSAVCASATGEHERWYQDFSCHGALGGMPIRPEEIEEQLRGQSKSEMVQVLEDAEVR
jgi:hypothetical protein